MSKKEKLIDKEGTAFRLSRKAKVLLREIAKEDGIAMTAVLESAIRKIAKERNIVYEDIEKER